MSIETALTRRDLAESLFAKAGKVFANTIIEWVGARLALFFEDPDEYPRPARPAVLEVFGHMEGDGFARLRIVDVRDGDGTLLACGETASDDFPGWEDLTSDIDPWLDRLASIDPDEWVGLHTILLPQ